MDPISVATALTALGSALSTIATFLTDIRGAPAKITELKRTCNFTLELVKQIEREISTNATTNSAATSFGGMLKDTLDQLLIDTKALLNELTRLRARSDSLVGTWLENGMLSLRLPYLEGMQAKIKMGQEELQMVLQS